jgi:hypothetical protein
MRTRLPHPLQAVAAAFALVAVTLAGCSSTGQTSSAKPSTGCPSTAAPPTGAGLDILPVIASSEFGVGANRVIVSFLDKTGSKPVASPDRSVKVAFRGPCGVAIAPKPATFVWASEPVSGVYILTADFPTAGNWIADFTTSAAGSPDAALSFAFEVKPKTQVLRPGDAAPSVKTPTLADVGGDVAKISTDANPVKRFYENSIDASLAAKKPFVVAFATPKFCRTATCGPTLDKIKPIAAAHLELTFINVEPYQLKSVEGQLQPVLSSAGELQTVPAADAFKLISEPYIFLIGSDGKIASSFELVFTPAEIEAAIKALT